MALVDTSSKKSHVFIHRLQVLFNKTCLYIFYYFLNVRYICVSAAMCCIAAVSLQSSDVLSFVVVSSPDTTPVCCGFVVQQIA